MRPAMEAALRRALESGSAEDLKTVSEAWASGLHTRKVDPQTARTLVQRGAVLSVHAAAGIGLTDHLARMLAADPALIDAKGCDACTPLHFARDVATAQLLLERGARIDARDEDHESTPAQWLVGAAPEVARYLLDRGATADIFLAAALGDRDLAVRLIDAEPNCVAQRIGRVPTFPPLGHNGRGGTIYQWSLAFNSYSHQIALLKGHQDLFELLWQRSDDTTRFLVSCVLARRADAEAIAARHPGIVATLPPEDLELLPRYCWETNTNYEAARLMLDLGFPIAHPEHSHGYTALHNAAWSGSADLVDLLIARGAPVDVVDPHYNSTPLGFALYDCLFEKRHPEGEFGRVARSLVEAGSPWDALDYPTGDAKLDDVFMEYLPHRIDGAALLGNDDLLARLLGEHPPPDHLALALGGAAKGGHVGLCRTLIDCGADVNSETGRDGMTPLMRALRGSTTPSSGETVALLLQHGADVGRRNRHGTLALHMAAGCGASVETVRSLLRAGAAPHIDVTNNYGFTPLSLATDHGRDDLVALLRAFGEGRSLTPAE
jgi:ankyrin repeat protein